MTWLAPLLEVLARVLATFQKKARESEQEQAQNEHDAIEQDPASKWDEYFGGGVSNDASMPDDAEEADKTNRKD